MENEYPPKNASYWKRRALKAEKDVKDAEESIKALFFNLSKNLDEKCVMQLHNYIARELTWNDEPVDIMEVME